MNRRTRKLASGQANDMKITKLTNDSPKVDMMVPGLNNIYLRPHQQTVVYAMLDREECRVSYEGDRMIRANTAVLSEPFGTGKTFEILSVILLKPVPKAFPDVFDNNQDSVIVRTFVGENALLRANLVIVGSSVLNQWKHTISSCTSLKVFMIKNYYDLLEFQRLLQGGINEFDIVLAKNGMVAGKFRDVPEINKEHNSIINVIHHMTYNRCFARVFVDDIDVINMQGDTVLPSALFTYLVSATKKVMHDKSDKAVTPLPGHFQELCKKYVGDIKANKFKIVFAKFNIRNSKKFVEESTNVTKINMYKYVYKNQFDAVIGLFGAVGEDGNVLMEMLNGDAYKTAAKAVGIKSISVADIFQRMLDNKYDEYIKLSEILKTIQRSRQNIALVDYHPIKSHSQEKLVKFRRSLQAGTPLADVKYKSEPLCKMLDDMEREASARFAEVGKSIHRVIDNAKEGMCQICCTDLNSVDTFIVKCCGIILCSDCGIQGNSFKKGYDRKRNIDDIMGQCANCKTAISLRDMIFMDSSFSVETLLNARGNETEKYDDEAAVEEVTDDVKCPKLRAMLAIIRGEVPEERQPCDIKIDRLLDGTKNIPPSGRNKVVIFASFDETLSMIQDCLQTHNIDYVRMRGTHNEMYNAVEAFRNNIDVLLINSQQQCAGVNLEFCNHMILFHHITDKNVIGQVVARGQRMLRTENLQLHFLRYMNEENLG